MADYGYGSSRLEPVRVFQNYAEGQADRFALRRDARSDYVEQAEVIGREVWNARSPEEWDAAIGRLEAAGVPDASQLRGRFDMRDTVINATRSLNDQQLSYFGEKARSAYADGMAGGGGLLGAVSGAALGSAAVPTQGAPTAIAPAAPTWIGAVTPTPAPAFSFGGRRSGATRRGAEPAMPSFNPPLPTWIEAMTPPPVGGEVGLSVTPQLGRASPALSTRPPPIMPPGRVSGTRPVTPARGERRSIAGQEPPGARRVVGRDRISMGGAPSLYYPPTYQRTPDPLSRPLDLLGPNSPFPPFRPAPPQPPNDRPWPQMAGAAGADRLRGSAGADRFGAAPGATGPAGFVGFGQAQGQAAAQPGAGGAFRDRLRQRENRGGYGGTNDFGYAGGYQFGDDALVSAGVYTPGPSTGAKGNQWDGQFAIPGHPEVRTLQDFLGNPAAQEAAADAHFAFLDREIQRLGLAQFIGKTIGGVPITQDGLYAMMHLGGPRGAEKFLKTGGHHNPADANGTRLSDYGAQLGAGGAPIAGGQGGDRAVGQAGQDQFGGLPFGQQGASGIPEPMMRALQVLIGNPSTAEIGIKAFVEMAGAGGGGTLLTPQQAQQLGFPTGTVVQRDSDGAYKVLVEPQSPDGSPFARLNDRELYRQDTGEVVPVGRSVEALPRTTGLPAGYQWGLDQQGNPTAVRIPGIADREAAPSNLAKLIAERAALPVGSPYLAIYDDAIKRASAIDPYAAMIAEAMAGSGGQAALPPQTSPQAPSDFSTMTAEELLAVDPSGLTPEQRAALEARYDELGL